MDNHKIERNLEKNGFYISRFWSGLNKNRSPLNVPITAMGLQVIQRLDTLWDGLNTEISPQQTLVRRPGLLRYCSAQLATTDKPLAYFSFKNIAGTIRPMLDTQTAVYTFSSSAITNVFTKSTTQQTSMQKVADTIYGCDGTSAWKWNGTTQTQMGIVAPFSNPVLSYLPNGQLAPSFGYSYVSTYLNSSTGHPSTASPVSANTGPLQNQTLVENQVSTGITATSFDASNHATVTTPNNFQVGQKVVCSGLIFATWLNLATLTITTANPAFFIATGVTHTSYTSHADPAGFATMTLSVPATPFQYTVQFGGAFVSDGGVVYAASSLPLTKVVSSPTVGQYAVNVALGQYTFAAADIGVNVQITYTYSLAVSTAININVSGIGSLDPQVDKIQIYRTLDGGSFYFLLATIANPAAGAVWNYVDSSKDSQLNTDILAPLDHVNDPPPAGISLLVWYAGRLWALSGNKLYFSAGPDSTNGVGAEAWPPANVFPVPGNGTGLAATSQGLVVTTGDNAYVVYGNNILNFTVPQLWQQNFGVANQNCITQDGDLLFFFTTRGQVWSFGGTLTQLGNLITKQLALIDPAKASIAIHRNGFDEGLYVSDGVSTVWRYSMDMTCWSPMAQPVGGVGIIASIETTTANWKLVMGRNTNHGFILARDTSTFSDDGTAYGANAVIGSLILAPPRSVAILNSICIDAPIVGTYPIVSVLLNEISGAFTALPNPVPDPPQLASSKTVWMKRHDIKAAQAPLPQHVRHLQLKIDFGTDTVQNELYGFSIV